MDIKTCYQTLESPFWSGKNQLIEGALCQKITALALIIFSSPFHLIGFALHSFHNQFRSYDRFEETYTKTKGDIHTITLLHTKQEAPKHLASRIERTDHDLVLISGTAYRTAKKVEQTLKEKYPYFVTNCGAPVFGKDEELLIASKTSPLVREFITYQHTSGGFMALDFQNISILYADLKKGHEKACMEEIKQYAKSFYKGVKLPVVMAITSTKKHAELRDMNTSFYFINRSKALHTYETLSTEDQQAANLTDELFKRLSPDTKKALKKVHVRIFSGIIISALETFYQKHQPLEALSFHGLETSIARELKTVLPQAAGAACIAADMMNKSYDFNNFQAAFENALNVRNFLKARTERTSHFIKLSEHNHHFIKAGKESNFLQTAPVTLLGIKPNTL